MFNSSCLYSFVQGYRQGVKAILYIGGGAVLGALLGGAGFLIALAISPVLAVAFVFWVCYKAFSY